MDSIDSKIPQLEQQNSSDSNIKKKQRSLSAEKNKQGETSIDESEDRIIVIGICCMEKKSHSKEMQEILNRMNPQFFRIDIFSERMILEDPIEQWPPVDCFLCFYSEGFPLNKAIAYVELRKPMMINDVRGQQILWDRKRVYQLLRENNIPLPKHFFAIKAPDRHIIEQYNAKEMKLLKQYEQKPIIEEEDNVESVINFLSEDQTPLRSFDAPPDLQRRKSAKILTQTLQLRSYDETSMAAQMLEFKKKESTLTLQQFTEIQEFDDYLLIDGQKLVKPFVEKPFDAEDHNIHIYYNSTDGGGCKKLFRKVGNQSSSFDPTCNQIRSKENENYIYEEFVQTNGFDIKVYTVGEFFAHAEARKSPVLDGRVLRTQNGKEMRYPVCLTPEEKLMATKIVNVFGQGVCGFDLLRSNGKSYVCDVNGWSFVKGNAKYYQDCASVLSTMILRKLCPRMLKRHNTETSYMRKFFKNSFRPSAQIMDLGVDNNDQELRSVVAIFRHGDRTPKQKMKMKTDNKLFLQFFDDRKDPTKEIKLKHPKELQRLLEVTRQSIAQTQSDQENVIKLLQMRSVLEKGGHFEGINRKVQLKPLKYEVDQKPTQVLVIMKWGGELTQLGEQNAEHMGQNFRHNMYPTDKDGLLRLHSTYRHDLKTSSSDEGRCQNTAAAFLKGFLNYEGEVTPILASMVIKNQSAQNCNDCLETIEQEAKISLSEMLQSEENIIDQFTKRYPDVPITENLMKVLQKFEKPRDMLKKLHDMIKTLTRNIRHYLNLKQKDYYIRPEDMKDDIQDETLTLFYKRWYKVDYDFKKGDIYNISKVPDIFDSIKFDILHNSEKLHNFCPNPKEFYELAHLICQFLVPFEYGITEKQKLVISKTVVSPLCEKIKQDLLWWKFQKNTFDEDYWKYRQRDESDLNSPWRHVRTRLYFTSASHMYSLYNVLYYGLGHALIENEAKQKQLESIMMLQYLSNIVIKLYEDLRANPNDPNRFRIEISVSDGIQLTYPPDNEPKSLPISENIHITQSLNLDQLEEFVNQIIDLPNGK